MQLEEAQVRATHHLSSESVVLKERFARLPPRPDPALLVILSIIHHRVPPRLLFGYSDLETLADFLLVQRNYKEVVRVIRQGVRWLQGSAETSGQTER
jgi:hypothetical protein